MSPSSSLVFGSQSGPGNRSALVFARSKKSAVLLQLWHVWKFGTRATEEGKKKNFQSVPLSTVNYNSAFLISFFSTMLFIPFQNKYRTPRLNNLGEQTVLSPQSSPVKVLIKHIYPYGKYERYGGRHDVSSKPGA